MRQLNVNKVAKMLGVTIAAVKRDTKLPPSIVYNGVQMWLKQEITHYIEELHRRDEPTTVLLSATPVTSVQYSAATDKP